MPSPLGHALGGMAIGLLALRPTRSGPAASPSSWLDRPAGQALLFAAVACAPDLDLLAGSHSTYTHSVGAVVLATLAILAWTRRPGLALAAGAAYASHLLFDWLGRDTSPPLGIMALWPFSHEHYMAPVQVLEPVSRRYWLPGFWAHTLKIAVYELLIFGSLAVLGWRRHARREAA